METNKLAIQFPQTKSEIKMFAQNMINSVVDGNVDPLKTKVQISALKKALETIEENDEFKQCVMNETDKYQKSELLNLFNAKIEIRETSVKHDFSQCGHIKYNRIIRALDKLNAMKKAIEDRLKATHEAETIVNEKTGEIYRVVPPTKQSKNSVVITINK